MSRSEPELEREVSTRAKRFTRARAQRASVWSTLANVVGLGWVLVLPLVLGIVGGRLLARAMDRPWLTLAGLALGLFAGAYGVFRQVKKEIEES